MSKTSKCGVCRQHNVEKVVLSHYDFGFLYDGELYNLTIYNCDVLKCSNCGTIQLLDSAEDLINVELRKAAKLLTPEVIADICRNIPIIPEITGISQSTLRRIIDGDQIQSRLIDNQLRRILDSLDSQ